MTTIAERVVLDPAMVFSGNMQATGGFTMMAKTFCLCYEALTNNRTWYNLFEVTGGKDVDKLPRQCPKVGSIVLVFSKDGRFSGKISRYVIADNNQVVAYYTGSLNSIYSYEASWQNIRLGSHEMWCYPGGSTYGDNICRIAIIEPPTATPAANLGAAS